MTIGTINGVNIYKITQQEVSCNPSAFQSKSQFWVEGDHKSELSEDEINYLKDKFHSRIMREV